MLTAHIDHINFFSLKNITERNKINQIILSFLVNILVHLLMENKQNFNCLKKKKSNSYLFIFLCCLSNVSVWRDFTKCIISNFCNNYHFTNVLAIHLYINWFNSYKCTMQKFLQFNITGHTSLLLTFYCIWISLQNSIHNRNIHL